MGTEDGFSRRGRRGRRKHVTGGLPTAATARDKADGCPAWTRGFMRKWLISRISRAEKCFLEAGRWQGVS